MPLSNPRTSLTGRDSLSVNPAAKEMSCGRAKAVAISQEMGGSSVRRPNCDKTCAFMLCRRMTVGHLWPPESSSFEQAEEFLQARDKALGVGQRVVVIAFELPEELRFV